MWLTEPGHPGSTPADPGLPDNQEALGGWMSQWDQSDQSLLGEGFSGRSGQRGHSVWTVGGGGRHKAVRCVTTALQWPRPTCCLKGLFPLGVQQVSISLPRPGALHPAASLKRQTRWLTELLAQNWPWGARGLTPLSPGRNAKSSLHNMLYCFIISMPRKSSLMLNLGPSWGHLSLL